MAIMDWLLESDDPPFLYQINKDILGKQEKDLSIFKKSMMKKGWVKALIDERKPDGQWGHSFYNPKWTCTHYVLWELCQLQAPQNSSLIGDSVEKVFQLPEGKDGGFNFSVTVEYSDICVDGLILVYGVYFGIQEEKLAALTGHFLKTQMADGGWNCEYLKGVNHSSMHTTLAVLEGLLAFQGNGYDFNKGKIKEAIARAIEFLLKHRLYKSDHTGEIIKDEFLKFTFPIRYKYDVLRALDVFARYGVPYDPRMNDALDCVEKARKKDGAWRSAAQSGKVYFVTEPAGKPGRWNTLRALRVMKNYGRLTEILF